MRAVVDRNVVMRRMTVFRLGRLRWKMKAQWRSVCDVRATDYYQDTRVSVSRTLVVCPHCGASATCL